MSNTDIAQKQLDAYNAQDLDTYVSFFAPDCIIAPINGAPSETSRDAIKARYAKAFATFPRNKAELKNRIEVGNSIVDHELVIQGEAEDLAPVDNWRAVGMRDGRHRAGAVLRHAMV